MRKLTALAAVLVGVTSGCSPMHNRMAMQQEMEQSRPIFVDDPDVFQVLQVRPQLTLPFRLAVVPPSFMHSYEHGIDGETEGERKEMLAWGDKLRAAGIISDLVIIPELLIGRSVRNQEYYQSLRVAAARLGADAVLLLRSVSDVDNYINPLGVLDITIVGMFVLPGHHKDALTIVEGVLLDIRNQFVYLATSAEGSGSTCGPLTFIQSRSAVQQSRAAALHSFGDRLLEASRMMQGGGAGVGPRYATPGK